MTQPSQVADATKDAVGQAAGTAMQEVGEVAGTAASAASTVASTAAHQAGAVAAQATDHIKDIADQARSQVSEQAGSATQKLSESVKALAAQLRSLSDSAGPDAGRTKGVAGQLADRGERLASYLEGQQPGDILNDARSFAARRPGGFLLGALAAGMATGRVVRGAAADAKDHNPAPVTPPPSYAPPAPYSTPAAPAQSAYTTPAPYVPAASSIDPLTAPYGQVPGSTYGDGLR